MTTEEREDILCRIKKLEETVGYRDILVSDCCGAIIYAEKGKCPVCKKDCDGIPEELFDAQ